MTTTLVNSEVVQQCDVIFLAVKPYQVKAVLQEVTSSVRSERHVVVSIVAGVTLKALEEVKSTVKYTLFYIRHEAQWFLISTVNETHNPDLCSYFVLNVGPKYQPTTLKPHYIHIMLTACYFLNYLRFLDI